MLPPDAEAARVFGAAEPEEEDNERGGRRQYQHQPGEALLRCADGSPEEVSAAGEGL
jgi:hypothetical protein